MKSVTLGRSIKNIGDDAFCMTSISTVIYNGTENDWKQVTFSGYDDTICKAMFTYLVNYGDANEDGKVNMSDAVLIMQSISNPSEYTVTEDGIANSDIVDRGDNLTINDALAIQMIEAKILTVDDLPITSEQIIELSNQ